MAELIAFTRGVLEDRFGDDPTLLHRGRDVEERCVAAQRDFANSSEAKARWRALFDAVGLDPSDSVRDRLMLRFQPPGERAWARATATVGFHRDSWGTNLPAQINWWAPVYPLDPGRTFAFLPDLFAVPLANSSAGYDIAEVMRRNREGPPLGHGEMVPRLQEEVDMAQARPVLIDPGELILFSSQHAHVGVGNHTDRTRISLETRTLRLADHRAGRGAANVDGFGKWQVFSLFRRISDNVPMHELLGCAPLEPYRAPAQAGAQFGR